MNQKQYTKKVIIDCDPGIDDMEAIFMILVDKNSDLIAITTVGGNGSAKQVYKNTRNILEFCKIDYIPIFKGPKINLSSKYQHCNGKFGSDCLGNINLQKCTTYKKEKYTCVQALIHYVNKYPGEIHLIATGPLTNIALALILDKHFPKKLASLSVMGGDRSEKTIENVTPYAEFNCYSDPCAWKLVMQNFKLSNNKKINLIDLTFCQQNLLPLSQMINYYNRPKIEVNYCPREALKRKTFDFVSKKFLDKDILTCDPFATFISLYPEYILYGENCILNHIDIQGEKSGHTEFKNDNNGNIFLVQKINFEQFIKKYFQSILPIE